MSAAPKGMELQLIAMQAANKIIFEHYLGPVTYSPMYCLASSDGYAVAVYSSPIAASFKRNLKGSLELVRLFKSQQASFETSQFLAATLRWLKKNTDAPCVFSYADPTVKDTRTNRTHTGQIYKITGFQFLGLSRITDTWLAGGKIISAAKCYRRYKTKSRKKIQTINPDWHLIKGEPKALYVFPLRKRMSPLKKSLSRYAACPEDETIPIVASTVRPREAAPFYNPAPPE